VAELDRRIEQMESVLRQLQTMQDLDGWRLRSAVVDVRKCMESMLNNAIKRRERGV
jgi:hypothetical protein